MLKSFGDLFFDIIIYHILLPILFVIIVIIGVGVFWIFRHRWHSRFALAKEDIVSQLLLLLSFFFLGVTLLAFNRDLGDPLSWRTVILVTSVLGLVGAYYFKTVPTLALSLIGLAVWWGTQAVAWLQDNHHIIKTSAIFAGLALITLLFYALGRLQEKKVGLQRFALTFLILGIIPVTGALFFLSTREGIWLLEGMTPFGIPVSSSWQVSLSSLVVIAAIVGVMLYSARKKLVPPLEFIAVLGLAALFGIIAFLPEQNMFAQGGRLSGTGVFWALVFNLAVFLELLGLIFSGYFKREKWLVNLGAFFFALLILVKYFDWFFTFLDKSVFFIGAGVLLFMVGWFMERGRRYILKGIQSEPRQVSQ
ncbi:hypothetical protein D6817_00195 [Candidatus Pacearchaeota archaeon]|nr:MAG: hypothetical protein D6817_00195 [Candidatus Pacearchaeota archaeon]